MLGQVFPFLKEGRRATCSLSYSCDLHEGAPRAARHYCTIGEITLLRLFLVIPHCPSPLLGRDLTHKLEAGLYMPTARAYKLLLLARRVNVKHSA